MDIKKQGTIYSISAVVFMFAQWVISVVLVRMGGFEDAGVFSLAMGVANMFSSVAYYGVRSFQISDVEHRYTQRQYVLARIVTVAASFAACAVYLLAAGSYSKLECGAILLYLVYTNVNAFADVLFGALQVKNKLYVNACSFMAKGLLCGAGMLTVYALCKDLIISLAAMALICLLVTVFYDWRAMQRTEKLTFSRPGQDLAAVKNLLKTTFPLMLTILFPNAITTLPRQAIFALLGKAQLGYFSSLFTPTALITTLMPSVILSVVPQLAGTYRQKDKKGFIRILGTCYGSIAVLTLLAELAAATVGPFFVKLLFGPEILEYYGLMYWAIIVSGLNAMGACGEYTLISMHRINMPTVITAMALAVLLLTVYPLVEHLGLLGAAAAWMIVYGLRAAAQMAVIGWDLRKI